MSLRPINDDGKGRETKREEVSQEVASRRQERARRINIHFLRSLEYDYTVWIVISVTASLPVIV